MPSSSILRENASPRAGMRDINNVAKRRQWQDRYLLLQERACQTR